MSRPINDMQLENEGWRNYQHIKTDSLWLLNRDDTRPLNGFVGVNVPEIQRQLYERYTRRGDVVLDPFLGTGTSIYVAGEMGRRSIGIDIDLSHFRWQEQRQKPIGQYAAIQADSTEMPAYVQIREVVLPLWGLGRPYVDFLFYHPPYADMVDYGDDPANLSSKKGIDWFLDRWAAASFYGLNALKPGGWAALVIADMYRDGKFIPLSHKMFDVMVEEGFIPKAEIIKNMEDNEAGSGKNANLKRYRSLLNGYFTFKHEKIYIFQKKG